MNKSEPIDLAMKLTSPCKEDVDIRAAGATCPMPGCGALAISYEAADSLIEYRRAFTSTWDFVCSECGAEFMAPENDLLFQAVPRDWLLSQVSRA
ncbi:MAG TPA: hypothetical protein VMB18_19485 [Terriglobales bacterium]|nr:hypothetical protein [Terriglobales bacterium]